MKYFTPSEATRTLPLVRTIVKDILDIGRQIRNLNIASGSSLNTNDEFLVLKSNLIECIDELSELGCYYKDWNFELGLVDFPALLNGEEVMLCWRSDEPELTYYHSIEEGYRGRAEIPKHLFE